MENKRLWEYIRISKMIWYCESCNVVIQIGNIWLPGRVNDFLWNYLDNRKQYKSILLITAGNQYRSTTAINADSCFFLLYINDIPKCMSRYSIFLLMIHLDIFITESNESLDILQEKVKNVLIKWFTRSRLTLKSYCSEIQHRFIPAVHIQHTILS